MLSVGMGGHRSLLMVMVWVWVQVRRKCWALLNSEWPCLKRRRSLCNLTTNQPMHFTNTLEHALIILISLVNGHIFMNSISLSKKGSQITNFHFWQNNAYFGS